MTQKPDWADKMVSARWFNGDSISPYSTAECFGEDIATALRSAYAEGERAGMGRAAVIVDKVAAEVRKDAKSIGVLGSENLGCALLGLDAASRAIRAAKETKE